MSDGRGEFMDIYGRTGYWAELPSGRVEIRIGRTHDALDALLRSVGCDTWAYITAYNPGSQPCTPDDNQRAQAELERQAAALGYRFFRGQGVGDSGDWPPEPSILIVGIPRDVAAGMGRRLGQNAIVAGDRGGPAELIWLGM